MRIISGTHKAKRIAAPKKLPVRPTTDMAKEALFNILNNRYYFDEISVLDLFSGTGNIAYEFASRGTGRITAVDNHYGCVKFINETSEALEFPINAIKANVFDYLEKSMGKEDIIFADPPYDMELAEFEKIPNLVFKRKMLQANGALIIEHASHMDLSHLDHFSEKRKYGGSVFSFFDNGGTP
ncbi:RsmD family RNA methyltransferase [Pseudozobellia thermophila]|uniref:16S rRNA (Guanine(966)-N(2))-methyltransferase RsmD n=1 Tax=Pseudozobellia thermophila TaxID=192903 RepID=A0A1M6GRA2_9FLAO|nr:RsmD family RNA methyltransferase [Pseudozobellia thermophila]SHJ12494.1 16S rRNA (guanine(966)-N(2))-methyltransferase RsmD [Pseudozobellia thermophila]